MTNGHVDLVRRASRIFDHVVVGVAESRKKRPLLSLETRVALARGICKEFENVTVQPFDGLLGDFRHRLRRRRDHSRREGRERL